MLTFHFTKELNGLEIWEPETENDTDLTPIFIFYKEDEKLSRHEILRRFDKLLLKSKISFLRPIDKVTGEWSLDLNEFRHSCESLSNFHDLRGYFTLEPEHSVRDKYANYTEEVVGATTQLKFSIYPDDLKHIKSRAESIIPNEITSPSISFRKDYPNGARTAFLMMKFEDSPAQEKLILHLRQCFSEHGITLLRADDKIYSDDLLTNIRTYMHCCDFGVAVFDRIRTEYFNPNVSLEIGYLMALGKDVILLKDETLKSLQTDLVGKIYNEYDIQQPENSLKQIINKWLNDKNIVTQ